MKKIIIYIFAIIAVLLFSQGCSQKSSMTVNTGSVQPGGIIQKGDTKLQLIGTPVEVGKTLPVVILTDAFTMKPFSLKDLYGKVVFLSVVPSIDTKVCEEQTHYLGEEGDRLADDIVRVTISRDTPFAQKRFAEAANLTDIQYLSDHRDASFGMATGLLIDKNRLLARSVLIVDKTGTLRYFQVLPQITQLPDMERAFDVANALNK